MLRCANSVSNDKIEPLHVYDVIRNPNYKIGKQFPYIITYRWLKLSTKELDKVIGEMFKKEPTKKPVQYKAIKQK